MKREELEYLPGTYYDVLKMAKDPFDPEKTLVSPDLTVDEVKAAIKGSLSINRFYFSGHGSQRGELLYADGGLRFY